MTLAALLLCALLQGGDGLQQAPRATARWASVPGAVEVGEPFELVLEVTHERGDAPVIGPGELESDVAWAVLEESAPLVLPDLDDPRMRVSEVRWSVVVLEPDLRMLPEVEVRYGGEPVEFEGSGLIDVTGVLAPGEDAPRPMPPDLGLGPASVAERGWLLALLVAGAAGLVVLLVVLLRRREASAPAAAPEATPLERLAALEEAPLDDPRAVREVHRELTRSLRRALDGATPRDALTDEEWLRAREVAPDAELAQLLAECAPVEYGAAQPTHWATRERVARARALAAQGVPA